MQCTTRTTRRKSAPRSTQTCPLHCPCRRPTIPPAWRHNHPRHPLHAFVPDVIYVAASLTLLRKGTSTGPGWYAKEGCCEEESSARAKPPRPGVGCPPLAPWLPQLLCPSGHLFACHVKTAPWQVPAMNCLAVASIVRDRLATGTYHGTRSIPQACHGDRGMGTYRGDTGKGTGAALGTEGGPATGTGPAQLPCLVSCRLCRTMLYALLLF